MVELVELRASLEIAERKMHARSHTYIITGKQPNKHTNRTAYCILVHSLRFNSSQFHIYIYIGAHAVLRALQKN